MPDLPLPHSPLVGTSTTASLGAVRAHAVRVALPAPAPRARVLTARLP